MLHQPRLLTTVAVLLLTLPAWGLPAAQAAAETAAPDAVPVPIEADRGLLNEAMDYRYDPIGRQLWEIPRE